MGGVEMMTSLPFPLVHVEVLNTSVNYPFPPGTRRNILQKGAVVFGEPQPGFPEYAVSQLGEPHDIFPSARIIGDEFVHDGQVWHVLLNVTASKESAFGLTMFIALNVSRPPVPFMPNEPHEPDEPLEVCFLGKARLLN